MEIAGRTVSAALEDLYDEVIRLRPDAPVTFRIGTEAELKDVWGAQTHTQRDLSCEIVLVHDFTELHVAHELLHAALYRRGFPMVLFRPDADQQYRRLRSRIQDALHHPHLFQELEERGFDTTEYWAYMVGGITGWSPEQSRHRYGDALMDALLMADVAVASTVDASPAIEFVKESRPKTWRIANDTIPDIRPERTSTPRRQRDAGLRIMRRISRRITEDQPNAATVLGWLGMSLVPTRRQLEERARRHVGVEVDPPQTDFLWLRSRSDGGICGTITELGADAGDRIAAASRQMALGEFLRRFGFLYTEA